MSTRKYFTYELKKSLFAMGIIALIMTAITVTSILTHRYVGDEWWITYRAESGIDATLFMGGLLAAVVPVWMFSYKMKKRSVDLYYSLPLSRTQVLRVKYLLGLVAAYTPFTVTFFVGALAAVIRFPSNAIIEMYYFPAYFAALPAIFCIYSISSFVFTRANRMIDGVVFIIFWALAPLVVMNFFRDIDSLINGYNTHIVSNMYMPTKPLSAVAYYFSNIVEVSKNDMIVGVESQAVIINEAIGFSMTGAWAIASSVLLFLTERRYKAENVGGVSNSAFGYKVMIPLFAVCILSDYTFISYIYCILYAVIIISAAFMLSALYKHTFKIGKIQAIILAASVTLGIVLAILLELARVDFRLDLIYYHWRY